MRHSADLTDLLVAWSAGDETARSRLIDAVYNELRGLARGYLRRERADHSLAPTALVHEAYLKLIDQRQVRWQNRAHFFAIAAHVMRRILVDHARTRGAAKRDGGQRVPLQDVQVGDGSSRSRRARPRRRAREAVQPRSAAERVGGAAILRRADGRRGSSGHGRRAATVDRDWALARAWLFRELGGERR